MPLKLLWQPRVPLPPQTDVDFDLEIIGSGVRYPYEASTRYKYVPAKSGVRYVIRRIKEMEVLKKGTVEPILVSLRDRLENLGDLGDVTNLRFDVVDNEGTFDIANQACAFEDMIAICLINTAVAAFTTDKRYRLYLKFNDGDASPILGPIYFRVEDN